MTNIRYEESKRQWAAFVLEETSVWPSDKPRLVVEYTVFGLGWEENGIYGVRGKVGIEQLKSIESQLKADEEISEQHLMTKGEGDYLLAVTYDHGETDDYGRVIHSPYWDVSVIGFRTFDEVISLRVAGSGEQP